MPLVQFHVSPSRGIRLQELANDREKVIQSPGRQCRANRPPPIPFAQRFVADMGMGDAVVGLGRMGFKRHDGIGPGFLRAVLPTQPDLERP